MSLDLYVTAWRGSAECVLDLLGTLSDDDWERPTDLPGWTVRDVVAHLAHLEAVLAGHETDAPVATPSATLASEYTEAGVARRRAVRPEALVTELRTAVAARALALQTLPADPSAPAEPTPAAVAWSWETALRNRVVDVWCHEQDIRRAVGRPGSLDSPAAHVVTHTFAAGMPFVLGKKVGPPVGTSVLWDLTDAVPLQVGATIGADGRAAAGVPDEPTATLTMSAETFTILAAGRRGPDAVDVEVAGDADLGRRVLGAMTLTF